ncbi:MAG: hypothetical protein JJ975_02105 [Bacteroidia bacterium]|nr:hypothetical protein [Bacteroidia bacterium]
MNVKWAVATLTILLFSVNIYADSKPVGYKPFRPIYKHQSFLEFGLGASVFLGDLGGGSGQGRNSFIDTDAESIKGCLSLEYVRNLNTFYGFGIEFTFGQLSGSDEFSENEDRNIRNLNFKSNIYEMSFTNRFTIKELKYTTNLGLERQVLLRGFVGLAGLRFNPTTAYKGKRYELQPLCLEGQDVTNEFKPYKRSVLVVPMGFNLVGFVSDHLYWGVETSFRKSFTDNIDDVGQGFYQDKSELLERKGEVAVALSDRNTTGTDWAGKRRGNPENNDNYFFVKFVLGLKLRR